MVPAPYITGTAWMRGAASNPGHTPLADSETCPVGWMDTVQESSVMVVWALMTDVTHWQPRYVKFVGLKAGANSLSSLLNFIQVLWGHRLGP